jgi:Asp/Glu/hydantoin racemase
MRLLIVNPNTSPGVTARIDAAAQSAAGPGDAFRTVPAAHGPSLIVDAADAALAEEGVLDAVAEHGGGVEGIILASFGDTGAAALRRLYPSLAILGIAEAAFEEARRIGGPFAIVSFAPEVAPPLRAMAERYGMGGALAVMRTLPGPLAHDPADVAEVLRGPLLDQCLACVADGVDSIVLGGGPLAGLARELAEECPIPLIDGTISAVSQMRDRIKERTPIASDAVRRD